MAEPMENNFHFEESNDGFDITPFSYGEESVEADSYGFDYLNAHEQSNDIEYDQSEFCNNNDKSQETYFQEKSKGDFQMEKNAEQERSGHSSLDNMTESEFKNSKGILTHLHGEAQRLRQYKKKMEAEVAKMKYDIRQREECIDNLRKNMLDVKIENENINKKLLEDTEFYEETNEKINIIQHYMIQIKSHFDSVNKHVETFKQYEEMMNTVFDKQRNDMQTIVQKLCAYNQQTEEKLQRDMEIRQNELFAAETQFNNELQRAEEQLHNINDALQEKILCEKKLLSERANLQEQIRALETDKKSVKTELDKLKLVESENKERIESLESARKDLEDQKSELENKITGLEKDLRERDEDASVSKQMINKLQNKVYNDGNAFLKERENLTIKLDKEVLRCEMMNKEYDEMQSVLNETVQRLEISLKNNSEAETEIETLKEKESELIDVRKQLEAKLDANDVELKDLKEKSLEIETNYQNEIATLNKTIATLSENNKDIQEQLSKAKNELYSKEIEYNKLNIELNQTVEEHKKEVENMKNGINNLEDKISNVTLKYEELCKEKDVLEKQYNDIKIELEQVVKKSEVLQNENQDLQEKLEVANQEVTTLKEEIAEIEEDLTEKTESIESLQSELEAAKSNFQSKTAKDKQTVSNLDAKVKSLKNEIQLKSKSIKELEKELKTCKDKLNGQTTDQVKLQDNLDKNNQLLKEKDNEIQKLTSELRTNNHKLEEALFKAQTYVKEKEAAKTLFDTQLKDMMNLMEKTQRDFHTDMVAKESELQEYKKRVKDVEKIKRQDELKDAELKDVKRERDELESENKNYKRGQKKLECKLDELENEVQKLKYNNQQQEKKLKEQDELIKKQEKSLKEQDELIKKQEKSLKEQEESMKERERALKAQIVNKDRTKTTGPVFDKSPVYDEVTTEDIFKPKIPYNLYDSDSSPTMTLEDYRKLQAQQQNNNPSKRKSFDNVPAEPPKKANISQPSRGPMVRMCPPKDLSRPKQTQTKHKFFTSRNKRLGETD